jgi:fumarate reductase subunit D
MTDSFFEHESQGEPSGKVPELDETVGGESSAGSEKGDAFATEEGRMAAIMSYIPILCFIPLLSMKENKEAHFHARQGVVLFLIELIAVIFLIDGISDLVFKGILILAIALSVAGIYFAIQGKNYRLPVISDLAEKTKTYTEPPE